MRYAESVIQADARAAVMVRRIAASAWLPLASMVLVLSCQSCRSPEFGVSERLGPDLSRVEQRLGEETAPGASEPNSLAYRRAVGEEPARHVSPREMTEPRVLSLPECLRLAFTNNNEIKQSREQMFFMGGEKLITNSRFLPTINLVSQYERLQAFEGEDRSRDASWMGATIRQTILEWGKDNPIDVTLRNDQRRALFDYENRVADVFSRVRKAFLFILLKEQQITARRELLKQFEAQARIKQQRMDANNLSTKIEVLTAQSNVLNERVQINQLEREKFNRKTELLRLVGLPVGANRVEFTGTMDRFGLEGFDMDAMIRLALAQDSDLAFREAVVAEQGRAMHQLRYEYFPDLRFVGGYQDESGRVGAEVRNDNRGTWGLDVVGEPRIAGSGDNGEERLGLFPPGVDLGGPDPGWFAGVQLGIPITEGGARTGREIKARAIWRAAGAAVEDRKDRVELAVRQGHMALSEQKFQVDLAQENVNIEKERFQIKEELRDAGKITDDELETFRTKFFDAQDSLFVQQGRLVEAQEDLRLFIRYFE
jgi:outer membrane protein TolC